MLAKIIKAESYKSGAIKASVFSFFAKGVAFLQGLLVAYFFGATIETDIFYFTFNIVIWSFGIVLTLSSAVIIPEFIKLKEREDKSICEGYANFYIYAFTGIGILIFILFIFASHTTFSLISTHDSKLVQADQLIVYCTVPIFAFSFFNVIVGEILVAHRFFTIPMIINLINSLLSIIFIYLLHERVGVVSFSFGLLSGYFINTLFLCIALKKNLNWSFSTINKKKAVKSSRNILKCLLGCLFTWSAYFIPFLLLSNHSSGTITIINFANKTVEAPLVFISTQLLSVLGIKINNLCTNYKTHDINRVFNNIVSRLIILISIISILIFFVREPLVHILYGQGELDSNSINLLSRYIAILALTLPFVSFFLGAIRLFYAFQKISSYLILQMTTSAFMIILSIYLIPRYGGDGYVYLQLVASIFSAIAFALVINYFRWIRIKSIMILFLCLIIIDLLLLSHIM